MPRIIGRVGIRGPPFLPHEKTNLCKNTRNTAIRVKVQHFSDNKNYQKIAFHMPRIMGRVKIHGPPFLPHEKTNLCKNTRNTAIRVKVQHFSDNKNYQKIALFMLRIMGQVGNRGPPFPPHKKTTLCKNTRNTANRVEVQYFLDIKNYGKIELFMPRIMGWVRIRGPLLPTP